LLAGGGSEIFLAENEGVTIIFKFYVMFSRFFATNRFKKAPKLMEVDRHDHFTPAMIHFMVAAVIAKTAALTAPPGPVQSIESASEPRDEREKEAQHGDDEDLIKKSTNQ
jgi:hypothetical protein